MIDPLSNFNWHTLYQRYDDLAWRYDRNIEYLDIFNTRPQSERGCYCRLCAQAASELNTDGGISVPTYTAIMYWKLYFLPLAIANICGRIRKNRTLRYEIHKHLIGLSHSLPRQARRDVDEIVSLTNQLNQYPMRGIKSRRALPARTTLLHFVYPDVVPIFDKQVLTAVGVADDNANHDEGVLRQYIPFAWHLADKHQDTFAECGYPETPLRLIDMALWVTRANCP